MPSIIHLPREVLVSIFESLSKTDQFTCQRVCKSWSEVARHFCYKEIAIDNTNTLALLRCFDVSKQSIHPVFLYIKSLDIECCTCPNHEHNLTYEEFGRLIQYCTRLEKLSMTLYSIYWEYLSKMKEIRLHRIQTLIYPGPYRGRIAEAADSYYSSLYLFRAQLHILVIHCSCDSWIQQSFGHLLNYLSLFPNLKHLNISAGSQKAMIYLHDLLQVCPALTKLCFQLDHPFYAPNTAHGELTCYPTLEKLNIYLPKFCMSSLNYIIQRFTGLRKLVLRIYHGKSHLWTKSMTEYLQRVLIPFLQQSLIEYSVKLDVEGPNDHIEETIQTCWFVQNTEAEFDVSESRYERTQLELIKDNGGNHKLYYIATWKPTRDSVSPCIRYMKNVGSKFSKLTISNYSFSSHSPDLDTILQFCPSIHSLTLEGLGPKFHKKIAPRKNGPQHHSLSTIELNQTRLLKIRAILELLYVKAPHIKKMVIANSQLADYDDTVALQNYGGNRIELILNNVYQSF
ncbi:hypothetical protein RMATCC62417_18086 [Rhizopus microsporus]|nr:hypothetical protein RMATCC62417_18086 [Rhizopus microsporus]